MEDRRHTQTATMDRVLKETFGGKDKTPLSKIEAEKELGVGWGGERRVIPVLPALPYRYGADRDPRQGGNGALRLAAGK